MQEGTYKLLAASTQRDQVVHAIKNLLTCNAHITCYQAELQKHSEDQILAKVSRRSLDAETKERTPCSGKVAITDLRIPLMWKDSDHFNYRRRSQRFAVFCLLKIEAEIFDAEMVIVDKALTDICFDDLIIFNDVKPNFELKLELYSCCMDEASSIANTPKRLVRKLSSLTRSTGKRLMTTLESGDPGSLPLTNPVATTIKYHLLAEVTLNLDDSETGFRTHNLTILGNEEASFWLPLYGQMCCRFVAQPVCMTENMMSGYLNLQQNVGELSNWTRLYCVLKSGSFSAYYSPEEIEAQVDPALNISINKETRIRILGNDSKKRTHSLSLINPSSGETASRVFAADSEGDLQRWVEAFWQHLCDIRTAIVQLDYSASNHGSNLLLAARSLYVLPTTTRASSECSAFIPCSKDLQGQWKHCCKELMKIEIMSPRKPPLFLAKQATSVYHDMNIKSPVKDESLMDIIRSKIQETDGEFLLGQKEESSPPRWAALFDGTHDVVFQKSRLAAGDQSPPALTSPGRAVKRLAPAPPPHRKAAEPTSKSPPRSDPEREPSENPITF
ncbi:rhotekin-2-like isoform X3 [Narcine bancroftii]